MYVTGQSVPQDYAGQAHWHRKPAQQVWSEAQAKLGPMYQAGYGIPKDYQEEVRRLRKAAERGNAHAQYSLGLMSAEGLGVPQDYVQADMWLTLAASRATGDDQKKYSEARDSVARKMTPQQIAEAQRLVQEWKPSK
jgi:uncharacterized protein